jgi:hypothetical protein
LSHGFVPSLERDDLEPPAIRIKQLFSRSSGMASQPPPKRTFGEARCDVRFRGKADIGRRTVPIISAASDPQRSLTTKFVAMHNMEVIPAAVVLVTITRRARSICSISSETSQQILVSSSLPTC